MIELKVHCDCGQKYKFDVEPVNNQMPFTVACPICQRDGTAKANAMLQQMAVFKPIEPEPASAPSPAVPPPFIPRQAAPPPIAPPPPPAPGRLRVNVTAPVAAPASPAATDTPRLLVPAGVVLPPTSGRARTAAATDAAPGKKPSFGLGLLGGFIGALVGGVLYYFIYKATGVRMFLALGVGALAGVGAHWLGKGEGSKELGGITVVFVIMAVLTAQYFVLLGLWNQVLFAGYTWSVNEAKAAIQAVPTGSDAEIRMYLARQASDDEEVVKPGAVTDDQIRVFREKKLSEYRDLASGKTTKEQYLVNSAQDPAKASKFLNTQQDTFKGFYILWTLNLGGVISLVLGGGLAYRFSTNA